MQTTKLAGTSLPLAATVTLQARAIVVDMEEGVIQHMLKVRTPRTQRAAARSVQCFSYQVLPAAV